MKHDNEHHERQQLPADEREVMERRVESAVGGQRNLTHISCATAVFASNRKTLDDAGEELILQRVSGNPFSDPETNNLVGRRVTVEGYRLNTIFRYVSADRE